MVLLIKKHSVFNELKSPRLTCVPCSLTGLPTGSAGLRTQVVH